MKFVRYKQFNEALPGNEEHWEFNGPNTGFYKGRQADFHQGYKDNMFDDLEEEGRINPGQAGGQGWKMIKFCDDLVDDLYYVFQRGDDEDSREIVHKHRDDIDPQEMAKVQAALRSLVNEVE